jgi:hypothetical protein
MALAPIVGSPERWQRFGYSNGESGGSFRHFEHVRSEFAIAAADRQHGERIGAALAAFNPRIAYAAAGGISVGYSGTIYDMMGLNDPVLARRCRNKVGPTGHACFDRERFYELLPDALLPRAASKRENVDLREVDAALKRPENWDNVIFRNLFNEEEFTAQYRMVRLVPDEGEFTVYGYFSVRFLLGVAKNRHIRMMFQ